MNHKFVTVIASGIGLLLISASLFGHHSDAAQFDVSKPVKVTGVVKKVEWTNPHIWFYVDVKDETGKVTTWGFSGLPRPLWFRDFARRMVPTTRPALSLRSRMVDRYFQAPWRSVPFPLQSKR